jgi:hypothetical protein
MTTATGATATTPLNDHVSHIVSLYYQLAFRGRDGLGLHMRERHNGEVHEGRSELALRAARK